MERRPRWILPLGLLGALVVIPALLCQTEGQPRRTFTHERNVETATIWSNPPRWDTNGLIARGTNQTKAPVLIVLDREGRKEEFLFTLEGAAAINIVDASLSPTGEVAVLAGAITDPPPGTALTARISADRKTQTLVRTWPYVAMVVVFAPDGTLWTMGHLKDEAGTREVARSVLRRYDPSGGLINSTTLSVRGNDTPDSSYLRASKSRVGWFTRGNQYLEFSLAGVEIGRYEGPSGVPFSEISGAAMSESGDFLLSRVQQNKDGSYTTSFFQLNRAARTWVPVSMQGTSGWLSLLGFDGDTLVAYAKSGQMRRFTETK